MATLNLVTSAGTLGLLDLTNFIAQDEGWTPGVTYLRKTLYGGVGPYAEVDENLTIGVLGSGATRYQNLRKLAVAMDEATRWARGENVTGATLQYAPDSGGAGTLSCRILGPPSSGDNPFGLGASFASARRVFSDNQLMFQRRGLWLASTEDTVAASAQASNKITNFTTFATHPTPSPVRFTITNAARAGGLPQYGQVQYLMFASGQSVLQSLAFPTGYNVGGANTTVVDAGSNSGSIVRFTSNATISATWGFDNTDLSAAIQASSIVHPILTYRLKDSSAPVYKIRCDAWLNDGSVIRGVPQLTANAANLGTSAVPLPLGSFAVAGNLLRFEITFSLPGGSPINSYIDFDTLAILGENDSYGRILQVQVTPTTPSTLSIDHELLDEPAPSVRHTSMNMPYQGDPVLMMTGTSCSVIWLATYSSVFSNSSHPSGGNHVISAIRRKAYLLPE